MNASDFGGVWGVPNYDGVWGVPNYDGVWGVPNDIWNIIFDRVDFNAVKQKDLCLVCKQWQDLLNLNIREALFIHPYRVSITYISNNTDKFNWWQISFYGKLSEPFMEKFNTNIYWDIVSRFQKLSEDFIGRWWRAVDWEYISQYHILSET